MFQSKPFKQIIENDCAALQNYLLAEHNQVDEAWEQFANSDLLGTFTKKVSWKVASFCRRYNRDNTIAEVKGLSSDYVNLVFELLRNKCQKKDLYTININELSKELHFSIRRVDEYLRKEIFKIPSPPKPFVRLFHIRRYKLKVTNSNQRAKAKSNANISSFLNKLLDGDNPTTKFIFDRFDEKVRQKILNLDETNMGDGIQNKLLRCICDELNKLIKEYDGEYNKEKRINHQSPFMFFDEFSEFVREEEKIKYTVALTNRYKNRELLSKVFPEISHLELVSFLELNENVSTKKNKFDSSTIKNIENLFDLLIKLPRVTDLVKNFWARVECCVSEFCQGNPEIYLFKFLEEEGKWTDKSMDDKSVKKCILAFCDNKLARFRRYKLDLRKAWKRVREGKGQDLYKEVCEVV